MLTNIILLFEILVNKYFQMFIRTPEARFQNLYNYNHEPFYIDHLPELDNMRMAYIDVGNDVNGTALCLHGNPTWGYMYRHIIPILIKSGFRVIVPDLIGYGRSDKPVNESWHTVERHHNILKSFVEYLSINNAMLICHDWGGIFGLNLLPELPNTFNRLVIGNTALPSHRLDKRWFRLWNKWVDTNNQIYDFNLAINLLPSKYTGPINSMQELLLREELHGFTAPYPGPEYKTAFRIFPSLLVKDSDSFIIQQGEKSLSFLNKDWNGQCFIASGIRDKLFYNSTIDLHNVIKGSFEPLILNSSHWVFEYGEMIIDQALKKFN